MVSVCHLRSSHSLYGPERQLLYLATSMPLYGFETGICVLYRQGKGRPRKHLLLLEASRRGVWAHQIDDEGWWSLARLIQSMVRILRQGNFSLVNSHGYKSNFVAFWSARVCGIPAIATVRLHTETDTRLKLYKMFDLVLLRHFSHVITVSDHLRKQMILAGIAPTKVSTVHNGVDVQAVASRALTEDDDANRLMWCQANSVTISIVGRLTLQKDHATFLRAARLVIQAVPDVRFLVIGDGPLRDQLEQLSRALGIDEHVTFLGYRQDVLSLMARSDVLVLSSVQEGLPNVILEALALGKPVVATHVGGVPEVIRSGETGVIVPPEDPRGLADAICWVLRNPGQATRLGQLGQARVTAEFSVQTMAQKTAAVYRSVLGNTPVRRA